MTVRSTAGRRWLALPAVTLTLAAIAAGWSCLEERALQEGMTRVLQAHVDSVSRLVSEGLRQTTQALDALGDAREGELRGRGIPAEPSPGLVVVLDETPSELHAVRGALGARELERVRAAFVNANDEDAFQVSEPPATCIIHGEAPSRKVACWDDSADRDLRQRAGLGLILREMTGPHVRYVAIQDQSGLLAASAGAPSLSRWSADPALANAQAGTAAFRTLPEVIESINPFQLPDGTTAVLRIGIDAGTLESLVAGTRARHRVFLGVLGALALASIVASLLLRRYDQHVWVLAQRMDAQERHAAHWQQVGQLAAEVAHEVRNPLSTVKMVGQRFSRELKVGENDQAELHELAALMGKEAARVETVITDFLDLSRSLRLEPICLVLAALLEDVVAPLRLRAEEEGKHVEVDCPGDGLLVRADGKRLYQALINLGGNALDAVAAGGRVWLRARPAGDGVELVVEDDGPGMEPEAIERVQRPFQTSKPQGTGLGLALTRRIIEAHGGTFRLESEPKRGTRATLWLPDQPMVGGEV